jgi:diaminohydroxyphosphoribosylaminopyrimidine deaminase/5-amino-6-(5-phosphoribosylamino)uracil reductase
MTERLTDEQWMQQTLALAREGVALTSPNPCVGAIVVAANGEVVGRGTHTYERKTHAEVLAIQEAGTRARGATLYINLEPCSHVGRTGPCADAVIEAGIRRVFVAMRDPNPLVGGRGIARMQAAGVEVIEGIGEAEAKKLNEAFARYIRHKLPFVTLKTAMTLDGKIAPPPGESGTPSALGSLGSSGGWITSEVARAHVHQMRHANDAILVGVGTVIADDPLLTDRTGLPRRFETPSVAGITRGQDRPRRRNRVLLLRRREQTPRAGVAGNHRGAGTDAAAARRQYHRISSRGALGRWSARP